uniref:Glabrous enhancer-binding protein-like DBD domain-containing protein n=1 Tax=Setaria italica TaxID=4555 RepID=K3YDR3_SETIT
MAPASPPWLRHCWYCIWLAASRTVIIIHANPFAPTLPAKSRAMAPSSPRREAPPAKSPDAPPEQKKRKTPPPHPPEAKRKPVPFQRTWPPGDEVRILEALAAHRRAHGGDLPKPAVLFAALDGHLERKGVGARKIMEKLRSFKRRYVLDAKKTAPPAGEHERRLYLLSRDVWAGDSPPKPPPVAQAKSLTPLKAQTAEDTKDSKDAIQAKSASEPAGKDLPKPRTLAEMREIYPYLVGEAMILMDPPILQELLPSIEENVARTLNKKIKKARKKLTKAINESIKVPNGLPHRKNEVVTSKFKFEGVLPSNVPRDNM